MKGLPTNIPDLEEPWYIFLLNKSIITLIVPIMDVSKCFSGFMLQIDLSFFDTESTRGFTSNSVAICSDNSYPFRFPSRKIHPPLYILILLVVTFRNEDKKCTFIQMDEDGELERSSDIMKTCHNMNIIVQTTGGYASSLNVKRKIPNKILDHKTRVLLMNSSHKK